MKDNYIGVFDSGIGGLSTLDELRRQLPNEDFFYFGDRKNNPYGEKTQAELEKIVCDISDFLIHEKSAKLIIVACNTATTKCISILRKKFPEVQFIGTEPAIKLACDSGAKNILVLATPGTIASERTNSLIQENRKSDQNIIMLSCPGLADVIEDSISRSKTEELAGLTFDELVKIVGQNSNKIDSQIEMLLGNVDTANFDAIVLGCTHYVLIREKIANFFPNAQIIDGNVGISRQTKRILAENNLLSRREQPGKVEHLYS